MLAQPVEGADRRLRVGHADVHVQRARRRARLQPAHLVRDQLGSARSGSGPRRRTPRPDAGRRRSSSRRPRAGAGAARRAPRRPPRLGADRRRRARRGPRSTPDEGRRRPGTAESPSTSTAEWSSAWVTGSTSSSSSSTPRENSPVTPKLTAEIATLIAPRLFFGRQPIAPLERPSRWNGRCTNQPL